MHLEGRDGGHGVDKPRVQVIGREVRVEGARDADHLVHVLAGVLGVAGARCPARASSREGPRAAGVGVGVGTICVQSSELCTNLCTN